MNATMRHPICSSTSARLPLHALALAAALAVLPCSAAAVKPLAVVSGLYGPAKDVGEMLIDSYFQRRDRIMERAARQRALQSCDDAYLRFWTAAANAQVDDQRALRYGQFFEKHCVRLWAGAG